MINIFLFLSLALLATFIIGIFLEKIHIPWVFAALLIGMILNIFDFKEMNNSLVFEFLANLGMYLLLFIIGFELNVKEIKKNKRFIVLGAIIIIAISTLFGSLFIHYFLHYNYFVSIVVALSFSTVGEAILIPILDEFKIINSKLGQTIISIGTIDDVLEIGILIFVVTFIGSKMDKINIGSIILSLLILLILLFGLRKFKKKGKELLNLKNELRFVFVLGLLFLFLGIGYYADAIALGAILAGISTKTFLPQSIIETVENEVKILAYGLLVPIFFLWIGMSMNLSYLIKYFIIIIALTIISALAKFLGSYLIGIKKLGWKQSTLLGIGLSVRFSTSIIIIKILYDNHLIKSDLYSTIIASSILFTLIIPIVFSLLLHKWKKDIII